ncbi:MAG: hypothetical protein R2795_19450 [Saprospiraceae bacterium]
MSNITPDSGTPILNTNSLVWQNLSLPTGASMILVFTAVPNAANDYTVYAEITAAAQSDPDSTPGNGVDTNGNGICADDPADEDDGDCVNLQPVPCSISASVSNLICDANNTFADPSDDIYYFDLTVNALSGSSAWAATVNGMNVEGNYNTPITL